MPECPLYSRGDSAISGKRTAEVKVHLTDEDKDLLSGVAVVHGKTLSEYVRLLIERDLHGTLAMVRRQNPIGRAE